MHAETRPLPVKSLLLRVLRPTLEYAKTMPLEFIRRGCGPSLSLSLSLSLSFSLFFSSPNFALVGFVAGK
jgi:hypothetical protein